MILTSWRKLLCALAWMVVLDLPERALAAEMESGPLDLIREKYDGLSPKGRFVAGAAVGFVGTRMALGTAMSAVKIGAVAFITTEVLHRTGVLDVGDVVDDIKDMDFVTQVSKSCQKYANGFRVQIRKRLNPANMQAFLETEKEATLGAASGTVVGILLF